MFVRGCRAWRDLWPLGQKLPCPARTSRWCEQRTCSADILDGPPTATRLGQPTCPRETIDVELDKGNKLKLQDVLRGGVARLGKALPRISESTQGGAAPASSGNSFESFSCGRELWLSCDPNTHSAEPPPASWGSRTFHRYGLKVVVMGAPTQHILQQFQGSCKYLTSLLSQSFVRQDSACAAAAVSRTKSRIPPSPSFRSASADS